jgi:HD-GYP domain-containing protein (c-di-GMP phosphodiesterase class II)
MESHVTRGVQLLRDLSSVPEEVVRIVRHHHEREDGKGYPDGLLGDEIPIGSKIIVLCDAVDAMLSDRPYRDALQLSDVLEQLEMHAGRQFDHRVVRAATGTAILAEFAESMQQVRAEAGRARVLDGSTQPKLKVVGSGLLSEAPAAYH